MLLINIDINEEICWFKKIFPDVVLSMQCFLQSLRISKLNVDEYLTD